MWHGKERVTQCKFQAKLSQEALDVRVLYLHEHNIGELVRNCEGGAF